MKHNEAFSFFLLFLAKKIRSQANYWYEAKEIFKTRSP